MTAVAIDWNDGGKELIDKAVGTLRKYLNDDAKFAVVHDGTKLTVRVNWVYPIAKKIVPLGGVWEGFEVWLDRRGHW